MVSPTPRLRVPALFLQGSLNSLGTIFSTHLKDVVTKLQIHGPAAKWPPTRALQQPAGHGCLRSGQPTEVDLERRSTPPRLRLPDSAPATPRTALAAALPGGVRTSP